MALTRGINGLRPCLRCLIPSDKQGDLRASAPPRTAVDAKATVLEARGQTLVGDKNEILKAAGLRDVDVRPHSVIIIPCYH